MEQYSIEECEQLFMALFPHGFAGSDVAEALAPNGWEKSPYVFSNKTNQKPANLENYNPNEALEQELKQQEEQKAKDAFKEQLNEMNAKQREDALYKPPPQVVQAYRNVFGKFPMGWPPV